MNGRYGDGGFGREDEGFGSGRGTGQSEHQPEQVGQQEQTSGQSDAPAGGQGTVEDAGQGSGGRDAGGGEQGSTSAATGQPSGDGE